ncbi:MAG: metallophosphoesterase [Ilumatobacter sp.]
MIVDVTSVTDSEAVVHVTSDDGDVEVLRFSGLASDTEGTLPIEHLDQGVEVRTLARPNGQLRTRIATVNDVHFGEIAAGQIDELTEGPIRRAAPGAEPYPEVMNRAAVDEIGEIDPNAVVVKGDLSEDGRPEEWAAFEACYRDAFGERLHVVRGNHDAYRHQREYAGDQRIDLPGAVVALLDTVIEGSTTGNLESAQFEWLDALASEATDPVIVMGHHQQWISSAGTSDTGSRSDGYFGLHPDASDALDEVCERRPSIVAYAAGHTHRHRVRPMTRSGVPSIEIGCTKDFPGTWAEYRVLDDGIMQIVHRMSSPEALAWSESCRGLYSDFGVDYSSYALGELHDRCFVIPLR